jgi:hypothetical protein
MTEQMNKVKELQTPSLVLTDDLALLSKSAAAKTLKVGKGVIDNLISTGKLGFILTESGSIRIPLFELRNYLVRNIIYNHPKSFKAQANRTHLRPPLNAKDIINKIKSGVIR